MKIVFLAAWRPDTGPAAVEAFLAVAEKALADGPFTACHHGRGLRLAQGGARQADWGMILDIEPENVEKWRSSKAHEDLGRALRPLCEEGMTLEF